jgi:2-polyprenyl-6-methoxyphenol hydroxylase-like FAD-dependent oxidoreductase
MYREGFPLIYTDERSFEAALPIGAFGRIISKMSQAKRAIIVGGGIGGLSAAIALRDVGFEVAVFERARALLQAGACLSLWPNAIKALSRMGLVEAVQAVGAPMTGGKILSPRGETLVEQTFSEELERRYGTLGVGVLRADLQAALLGALDAGVVRLGAGCVGFEQDSAGVVARFADGREERGDLLIGADGINSVIRAQLFGEAEPTYTGYTAWIGVTRFDHELIRPGVGLLWWGRGAQFGLVPITHGRVYWFATINAPGGEDDGAIGRKRRVFDHFRGWHGPIEAVIEATEESTILRYALFDREPLKHWSRRRTTLLGDAAHPMSPSLGQGACQAIEDAVVLAACLRKEGDIVTALHLYEARRTKRANEVTEQSRSVGRMIHWENPLACWLRDALMRRIPLSLHLNGLEWIFRYEAIAWRRNETPTRRFP